MTDYDNYKSINLEDYINCVVKVLRRCGISYYGKVEFRQDDTHPFIFNLGNGGGLCYTKSGNVLSNNKSNEYDIIGIQKIAEMEDYGGNTPIIPDETMEELLKNGVRK